MEAIILRRIFTRLIPKVRRHYLFALAAALWSVAGIILCVRGTIWLLVLSPGLEITVAAVCIASTTAGYVFGF